MLGNVMTAHGFAYFGLAVHFYCRYSFCTTDVFNADYLPQIHHAKLYDYNII